jgi:glycosyltransferase involved in cell wall biosynthesis
VTSKPELLCLSPVVPGLTGNGLAMRGGLVLEALAAEWSISLLVYRLYAGPDAELRPELRRLCARAAFVTPARGGKLPGFWTRRLSPLAPFLRARFDAIHVFRLAMMPLAESMFPDRARRPDLSLDLDDIESETHARLAALCRSNGDAPRAMLEASEARRADAAEREALRTADRIYVCSEHDRRKLEARGGAAEVRVLPNGVRLPANPAPAFDGGPFRFLFIGTLGYYPNEDAALQLCREIAPRVRERSAVPVEFEVVGGGASARLREAAAAAGVRLLGAVPSVGPAYAAAGSLVVPLRAGGGTRIKILEAMSYRRPVISTTAGAEGLDVTDGRDILIADGADAIAGACVRLARDRELRASLAENGHALVQRSYTLEAIRSTLTVKPR